MPSFVTVLSFALLFAQQQGLLTKEIAPHFASEARVVPLALGDSTSALAADEPVEPGDGRDDGQEDDARSGELTAFAAMHLAPAASFEAAARTTSAPAVIVLARAIQECGPPYAHAGC